MALLESVGGSELGLSPIGQMEKTRWMQLCQALLVIPDSVKTKCV